MGYKDKDAQREYQKNWIANKRAEFFKGKRCKVCRSTKDLELDHRDPKQKVDHRIFSWSWDRINAEAAKCTIRCRPHHEAKTKRKREYNSKAILTEEQVAAIRAEYVPRVVTQQQLADKYGVDRSTIGNIIQGKHWK